MPRIALLTPQERLERKRLAERLRMDKIRSDPEQYAQWTAKRRESYSKKKLGPPVEPPPAIVPMWEQQLKKQAVKPYKRKRYYKKFTEQFGEDAQLNEVEMKSDSLNAESNDDDDDPLDEHSDDTSLATFDNHMYSSNTFNQEADTDKPLTSECYTEGSVPDTVIKLEPYSPEPLIPQISIHECPEPLAINMVSPELKHAPEKSRSQTRIPHESPWGILREFERSIKKQLDSKDKLIEELKMLNDRYRKQVKLLRGEKIKEKTKCPHCDGEIK